MKQFLDNLSFPMLMLMAILLGTAPLGSEPHLIEKMNMLWSGTLSRPLDIFDLVLHSAPFVLLVIKIFFLVKTRVQQEN